MSVENDTFKQAAECVDASADRLENLEKEKNKDNSAHDSFHREEAEDFDRSFERDKNSTQDSLDKGKNVEALPYAPPLVAGSHNENGDIQENKETQRAKDSEDEDDEKKDDNDDDDENNGFNFENIELPEILNLESDDKKTEELSEEPPEDGEFEYVDDDGKRHVITYENGELTGPIKIFDKNDQLEFEGEMKKGKLCGMCKTYEQGILRSQTNLLDNLPQGLSQQFDEHNNLITETNFEKGVKQGEMKQYYPTGELLTKVTFDHDEMNGPLESYNGQGEILMKTTYKKNKIQGNMENFYTGTDGIGCMRLATYKEGELQGKEVIYHSSGSILSESYYEAGQLKAPPTTYPPPKAKKS